jgi:hypothetical protein
MNDNTTPADTAKELPPDSVDADIASNTPIFAAARRHLAGFLKTSQMTQRAAAEAIGIAPSALNAWLQGKYPGNNEGLTSRIAAWLSKQEPQRPEPALAPKVVETSAFQTTINILAFCQAFGKMGLVDGEPGVGKSTALNHFRTMFPDVWCLNACPTISTLMQVLRHLGYVVGLDQHWLTGGEQTHAIRRHVSSRGRGLIIIDEAQNLDFRALEELRSIHDATQVGLVFVGNSDLWNRMTGGQAARYGQIRSRIQVRATARRPTKSDVERFAAERGVTDPQAVELLRDLSGMYGSMRVMSNVLALASRGTEPTPDNLRSAMTMLGVAR